MKTLYVLGLLWLAATAAAQEENGTEVEARVATLALFGRPGAGSSSSSGRTGPRFTSPPKNTWYGWNDNRYCQTAPEQCIPSPYAIDAVTCFLDSNGYVVGLKYYYTDGSLGGQVGYCNGASVGVNAGDGGVFVGVQTCKGAWGGYKSITWFNDCGDQVTCGNTRTDMNSWDYWGKSWNAPQPNKFVCSWLNPDVWGQGYWNYFGGYQTQNTGFQSKFGGMFSKWAGPGMGWGRRSLTKSDDEVATSEPTAEVQARLDEAQVKAATWWLFGQSPIQKPNPGVGQTPPYWETCQYVNSRGSPPVAKAARSTTRPWYAAGNPLGVKNNRNMWKIGNAKTTKANWVKPTDKTYLGYKKTYTSTYECATDYDGYYKNVWPIWKITGDCFGGCNAALSNLQFYFNKCYCPCDCNNGGGGTTDGTGISMIFNLGCTCADLGNYNITDLVGASAYYLQNYLEGQEGLGANSVTVEYNPDYSTDEPTGAGTCTSCVLTVDGIVTANPGYDQQLVYDSLVNLSEQDEPDLCYYPDEILDCANYPGLFPRAPESDCDPDPASGIFILVLEAPFKKANAERVKKWRKTIKMKTLLKSMTNINTVRATLSKLNKAALASKALAAKSASTDDGAQLLQQIAQMPPQIEPAAAAVAAVAAPVVDDVAGP